MKLSVIILSYNVKYFLELCLRSVEQAITSLNAEIIVVDNDSSDDSCEMVREKFSSVILISNKDNAGFSKANNQAIKVAKGEFVCILNPDTVVAEDTFTRLLTFANSISNLGAIGCKLIDGSGSFLPESKRNIPVVKVAMQKLFGNGNSYYANHLISSAIGKVDILVGAFMMIKRDVFNQVQGFDEDYFMYGEDIDLSYKLLQNGFQNYYFGETTCIHYKGESTTKDKKYTKRFYNAMKLFYKKHFKTNLIIDNVVSLGINFAHFVRGTVKIDEFHPELYYFIAEQGNVYLSKSLGKNIIVQNHINDIKENSEVIFDANMLSYKDIIKHIENLRLQSRLSFKILPKNANYIIGSNDALNRGKVIQFNHN